MLEILSQSIWRDEAFSLLLAERSIPEIVILAIRDSSPPLYYLILHYWLVIFGNSPEVGRVLSFLFHLLSLLISYFIAKKLRQSRLFSLLAALLVFLNPFLLQYAFEVRNYSLYVFLCLTSLYFFLSRKPALFSLFITLSLLTHNYTFFILVSFLVAWVIIERSTRNLLKMRHRPFLKYFLLPLVTTLLWGPFALSQYQKMNEGFWINRLEFSEILEILKRFAGGDLVYPQREAVLVVTGFVAVTSLFLLLRGNTQKAFSETVLLASTILIPPLLVFLVSLVRVPIYHERYLIPAVPLLIVFFIWQLFQLIKDRPRLQPSLSVLLLLYLLASLSASLNVLTRPTKPPIEIAVAEILREIRPNEIILSESNLNFLEVKYYVRRLRPDLRVYTYSPNGRVVFYIGGALFEKGDILTSIPQDKTVWQIQTDGRFHKLVKGHF